MENNVSFFKFSLTSGLTVGALAVMVTLLERIDGLAGIVSIGRFILLIAMTMYFTRMYRDRYNGGYITGGRAFSMALVILVCVGVIAAIYTYIKTSAIPADTYNEMIEIMKDTYEQNGISLTDENWNDVLSMIPYATALMTFIGHVVLGAMVGGIAAMKLRRENVNSEL